MSLKEAVANITGPVAAGAIKDSAGVGVGVAVVAGVEGGGVLVVGGGAGKAGCVGGVVAIVDVDVGVAGRVSMEGPSNRWRVGEVEMCVGVVIVDVGCGDGAAVGREPLDDKEEGVVGAGSDAGASK